MSPLPLLQSTALETEASVLLKLPYFAALSIDHQQALAPAVTVETFEPEALLFNEGDMARAFYAVLTGKVQIYKLSPEGREVILHLFGAGEIFAEVPIFNGLSVYPAYAKAVAPTSVLRVDGAGFLAVVHQYPQILLGMMTVFARRLHQMSGLVEDLSLRSVDSRLAKYLLEVSVLVAPHQPEVATLPVNKKTLAGILGTIPETLSRSFRKLQDAALIDVANERVTIVNRGGLAALAQVDL